MNKKIILSTLSIIFFCLNVYPGILILKGGTIIDVSNYGHSQKDIVDSIILIEDGKIISTGTKHDILVPPDAEILDVSGKFILPGLIDGFAAMDNNSFADAFLFMGVTSIIGVEGFRRSPLYREAQLRPNIFNFGFIGKWKTSDKELLNQIDGWAKKNTRVLNLMYELRPEQLKLAIEKAHESGMTTIGELGYTSYIESIRYGIDIFIHSIRYVLELAPDKMKREVAADPFGPAAQKYVRFLRNLNPEDPKIEKYANILGESDIFLMPTLILSCNDLPFVDNPWREKVAKIINPEDLHEPLEKSSGKHPYKKETLESRNKLALNIIEIEKKYYQAGAKYLAGSGTDAFGTIPGISLHQELKLLTRIGLNERPQETFLKH